MTAHQYQHQAPPKKRGKKELSCNETKEERRKEAMIRGKKKRRNYEKKGKTICYNEQ